MIFGYILGFSLAIIAFFMEYNTIITGFSLLLLFVGLHAFFIEFDKIRTFANLYPDIKPLLPATISDSRMTKLRKESISIFFESFVDKKNGYMFSRMLQTTVLFSIFSFIIYLPCYFLFDDYVDYAAMIVIIIVSFHTMNIRTDKLILEYFEKDIGSG